MIKGLIFNYLENLAIQNTWYENQVYKKKLENWVMTVNDIWIVQK